MVDLSQGASFALGVIVGLLSTAIQGVGLTLQRKSHLLEEEKDEYEPRRPPYRRRRWQIGMGMFLLSNIVGSTIQITTLPLPVLSTLQASGLVFNSICAAAILKEPFTRYSLFGTVLVAGGAVLIGIYGSMSEPSHTLNELLNLLARPHFVAWLVGTAIMVLLSAVGAWAVKRFSHRQSTRTRLMRGMCFGFISGVLSAHCLLLAKSAVELLVRTIADRHNQFNRWQSWMILLGLIFLALSQLWYLHRGLKLCSTSVLYPFVFCIYNIIAIIDGLIYFNQTSRLTPLHAGLVAVGTVILLAGVLALSWRLEHQDPGATPTSHMSQPTIVQPPVTALTPGMGLVNATLGDDQEGIEPFLGEEHYQQDFDEEHGFSPPHAVHRFSTPSKRRNSSLDERTPLLRAPTAPSGAIRGRKSPGRFSPRRSMRRNVTINTEADEIWDELNDSSDQRRSSIAHAPRSPQSLRSSEGFKRPRSGTLPPLRTNIRSPARSNTFDQWRRRSWWEGLAQTPLRQQLSASRDDDQAAVSDGEDTDGSVGQSRIASGDSWRQEEPGAWFKLRWWKKRWRDGQGGDRRVEEGEGSGAT